MKPRLLPTARLSLPLATAIAALLAVPAVHAATITWDANGATAGQTDGAGTWDAGTNWWNGTTNVNWTSGDNAVFGNAGAGGAVTLAAGTTVGTLTFNAFTGTYTLGTGTSTIILNSGITLNAGAGAVSIISPLTLGGAQSWLNNSSSLLTVGTGAVDNAGFLLTIGGTGNTAISSAIGGAGGFTKTGTGTATLTGANGYTGTTTINAGTLAVGNGTTGSLNGTTGTALTFGGTGTFNVIEAASSTQGMGLLTLSAGQATIQSTFASTAATLTFSNVAARTAGATANFVTSGGTNGTDHKIVLTNFNGGTTPTGTLLDRGIFYNGTNYATYDAGGFIRGFTAGDTNYLAAPTGATIGASTATSNVDLTTGNITAQTTVSANTINMRANSITMSGSNQVLSVNGILSSGSGAASIGGGTSPRLQATAAGGEIVVRVNGGSDVLSISSAIRNFGVDSGGTASALTKTGAGTLTINTAGTFTGALNVNSGVLNYGSSPTYSSANLGAGATWNYVNGFGNNPTFNVPFTINGSFVKTGNGSMTFNSGATISGSGSLSFSGQVTIAINSDNPNFTGTINEVSQGGSGFNIGHNGALGAGLLVFGANNNDIRSTVGGGGYVAAYSSTYRFDASRTFGGNGVNLNFGSGAVTLNAAGVVATVSNTTTFGGAIGESGGSRTFGKAGAGTLVLGGSTSNTYTGLTSVTAGTLQLNKSGTANAIGAGGLSVGTGATVTYTGASTDMIANAAPVTVTGTGLLNLNGVSDTIGTLGLTAVAGNNALVTTGAGTLTLGGNVTFTAATTGTAQITGNLNLGAATRTFNVGLGTGVGQDLLVNAVITGGVGLTKTGTGRLTLSGANSYTGLTTVSDGTLRMTTPSSLGNGGLTVAAAKSFIYSPTTAGALNLGSGAVTLAGGAAFGTAIGGTASQSAITSTGAAVLSGTGTINIVAIAGATPAAGTHNLVTALSGLTAGTYTLGTVFNNTDFFLSNFTRTATAISVDVTTQSALSGNVAWKGGLTGSTGVWSATNGTSTSNWQVTDGVNQPLAPGATADLVFSTATSPGTMVGMSLGANMTVRTITVNNSATAFGLNADGNTLTITPSSSSTGITLGAGALSGTINAPVTLGAAQTWTNNNSAASLSVFGGVNNGGNALTFDGAGSFSFDNLSGVISGSGGVVKNGAGSLTLSAAANVPHTFTGGITLNGGKIAFQNPANLTIGNMNITGGYLAGRFASSPTWSGLGTGAGQIQITGGTSGFSGEGSSGSTFTIGTALSVLVWGASGEASATGFFNPSVLIVGGAGPNTNAVGSLNNGIDLNGATRTMTSTLVTDNGTGTGFTISGVISNSSGTSAGLTKTGVASSNLRLAGANTYNGTTTFTAGFLTLANALALQNSVLDTTASIAGSGTAGLRTTVTTLTLGGLSGNKNFATTGGIFTSATGGFGSVTALTLNPGAADTPNYSGNIENGAAGMNLTKSGAGTQILSGTNSYSGTTTVSAGTLAGTNAVQSFGTNLSGISIAAAGTLSLRNDGTVSFTNGASAYNIANSASGATINVDRVTGTGSNTITVGNLTTSSAAATWQLNFTGANGVSLNAGTLITPTVAAASHTINNNIAGGGSLTLAGVTGGGTGATATLIFTGSANTTLSGAITQAATAQALTKNGAGTLTLNGNSAYTGITTITSGVVEAATLDIGGNNSSIGKASNAAASLVFGAPTATLRYTGGSNVTIDRGFTLSSGVGGGATIESSGAGTLSFNNTVALAYGTTAQTRTLTLGGSNVGANTFGKVIDNNTGGSNLTSVVKSGNGTWVLDQANTYDGTTAVNGGKLLINGNQSGALGAVSVAATTTLGGSGTVGGATTFTGASIHAPGSAAATVGNQTFSSTVTYGTGTIFDWDLNTLTGGDVTDPGVVADASTGTYDQVTATGAITATGSAAIFKIVLAAGDSFADAFWNTDKSWTNLFTGGAGSATNLAAMFSSFDATGGLDASGLVAGQGQFTLSNATNTLSWAAVPEPTSALVGLLVGAGLLRRRRNQNPVASVYDRR